MPRQKQIDTSEIRAYVQHGFVASSVSGKSHIVGDCPFCGTAGKFYVNKETKAWDCKAGSCGERGGFQTFMQKIVIANAMAFRAVPAKALSRERGIRLDTMRNYSIGYNVSTETYTIPVFDSEGDKVTQVRLYKRGKLMNTATCGTQIYGLEKLLPEENETVWLCEGEWDTIAMCEILTDAKRDGEVAVGSPGAPIFKDAWSIFFKDKTVNVVYDNDDAGREGARKVYNALMPLAKDLRFIQWTEKFPDKWDIRDLYVKTHKCDSLKTYKSLCSMLDVLPQGVETKNIKEKKPKYSGVGVDKEEVYDGYRKWLKIKDTAVLDVLFGTVIANRLPGDPLWLFIVAPSGGMKTELIMSIAEAPNIEVVSSMTPHTLMSGSIGVGGSDPSLLPKLDGKVLTIKDFTSILAMNQTARDEILGTLRDIYDGEASKPFGIGKWRKYKSKFGILAGVTPAIELFVADQPAVGERFVRYHITMADTHEEELDVLRKVRDNLFKNDRSDMRKHLREIGRAVLMYDYKDVPELSDEISNKILHLAQFTAILRGTITRERYSKEITHKPMKEFPSRLVLQFCKLVLGIAMFKRREVVTAEEYTIVRNIATSTVPSLLEGTLRGMYALGAHLTFDTTRIREIMGMPPITCERMIENMVMLGILTKERISHLKTEYRLTHYITKIIREAELYGTQTKKKVKAKTKRKRRT